MIRARERGMSFWPFVVTLVLLIVSVYLWFEAEGRADSLKAQLATANQQKVELQQNYDNVSTPYLELTPLIGESLAEGGKVTKAKIATALDNLKTKLPAHFAFEFPEKKYVEEGTGEVTVIEGDRVLVSYMQKAEVNRASTLYDWPTVIISAAERMKSDIGRLASENMNRDKALAELQTGHAAALQAKDTEIANLRNQITQLQQNLDEVTRDKDDQISGLRTQLESAQGELESVRSESEAALAKLSSEKSQLESQVVQLNNREKPFYSEGPDGQVLAAGAGGLVIINRGKNDMLMPGTTFSVATRIKGGDMVANGSIKVISCADETAECKIQDAVPGFPITTGDVIQSTVYSPNRTLHFYLLGDFNKMGRTDAEARLTHLGAKIDQEVVPTTHYVVLGTPAAGETLEDTTAYRRAKEYGLPMITERDLESFTRY